MREKEKERERKRERHPAALCEKREGMGVKTNTHKTEHMQKGDKHVHTYEDFSLTDHAFFKLLLIIITHKKSIKISLKKIHL